MLDTIFTLQIYSSSWNVVKAAYLFCRYYPLATAPFHIWGFVGDNDLGVCKSCFHALYATAIPTVCSLLLPINIFSIFDYRWCPLNVSNNLEDMLRRLFFTLLSAVSSVILMWRTYAFSGMKRWVLTVLSTVLLSFVGATIWVTIKELGRLSR